MQVWVAVDSAGKFLVMRQLQLKCSRQFVIQEKKHLFHCMLLLHRRNGVHLLQYCCAGLRLSLILCLTVNLLFAQQLHPSLPFLPPSCRLLPSYNVSSPHSPLSNIPSRLSRRHLALSIPQYRESQHCGSMVLALTRRERALI